MNGKYLLCRLAEVNGTKTKSLRTGREMPHKQQKSRARKQSLLGSQFVYIGVLSDDFAAIDVREELCQAHATVPKNLSVKPCDNLFKLAWFFKQEIYYTQ